MFFIAAAGELLSHIISIELLHHICKPLLLVILSLYFYLSVSGNYNTFAKLMQVGFFLAWVGDVVLMYEDRNPMYFIFGLLAFLLTHICYIIAFFNSVKSSDRASILKSKPMLPAPFVLLGGVIFYMLYPNLGDLTIPVFVYTAVIVTMVIAALNRMERVQQKSFQLIFYGALFFMLSDLLLAANKFLTPIPYAGVLIMGTYIAAQYIIVKGSILQVNSNSQ